MKTFETDSDDYREIMDIKDKMSEERKENKPLSFSISMILGEDRKKNKQQEEHNPALTASKRVPMATIHHYAPVTDSNYIQFESALATSTRKCSTPESDECPSPDITSVQPMIPSYSAHQNIHPLYLNRHHKFDSNFENMKLPARSVSNILNRDSNSLNILTDSYSNSPSPTDEKRFESDFVHSDITVNKMHRFALGEDKSLDSLGESYQNSPSPMKCKKKKTRTVFSRSQIYQLENAFEMKRYLSSAERSGLATRLQLSETQIKIWFQNRRNKWKRQISGEMDEIPIPPYALHSPTGLLPSPYLSPVSPYGSVAESRDALLRGSLVSSAPAFYSNPYVQETRLRPSFIS